MQYTEEEMLMLSGIQHYMFCPRQWALIHIEQQWDENRFTVEGQILHTHVDNPAYRQKNGSRITLRAVPIASKQLGLYGISDAIELRPAENELNSITHPLYTGNWIPYPIEYKRGHQKPDERDEVQLVAQAMCLEEMYNIKLTEAALYYGETKHRVEVELSESLRQLTKSCAEEMHQIYKTGKTPAAIKKNACKSCSLVDLCIPQLVSKQSVANYLKNNLYEKTP